MDLFSWFHACIYWLRHKWEEHQENKKYKELYARLDRNKAGRFNMKEHRKWVYEQQKAQRKKNKFVESEKGK